MLGSSSSVVMSPGPMNLTPALSRPRSPYAFMIAVACFPAGTKPKIASGLASFARCMKGMKSGFASGMRTSPTILPPPSVKPLMKAACASWPGPKSLTATYAVLNFFAAQAPIGRLDCHSVNDSLTMYGDMVVITDVPAFMITIGTFASVDSGAEDIAFGVQVIPARNCTLSRTISSCESCFALSGLGPPSSRVMTSTLTPGGSLSWLSFWYSLIARSMFSPSVALGPDRVSTEPILIVWADACTANSSAPATRVAVLMTCFTLPSSQEIRLILYQPGERGTDFLIDLDPHLLDKLPVLVVVAADQGGELRGRADVGFQPSGAVKLL